MPGTYAGLSGSFSIVVDLIAAAILGGVVGVQRQIAHKPAGFRTHVLVALGACAFMETSRLVGDSRIAAGVITGVGFLGAGAIVRQGIVPHGLTTAATIWTVAAIGLALGLGTPASFLLAAACTTITYVGLSFSDALLESVFRPHGRFDVHATFDLEALSLEEAIQVFSADALRAKAGADIVIVTDAAGRSMSLTIQVTLAARGSIAALLLRASKVAGIRRVSLANETPST